MHLNANGIQRLQNGDWIDVAFAELKKSDKWRYEIDGQILIALDNARPSPTDNEHYELTAMTIFNAPNRRM